MQNASMAANWSCSSKTHDSCRKISVANKVCLEEEKRESSAQSSTLNSANDREVEEGSRDQKWHRLSEEDYIYFCFRDDGAIHKIDESKSSKTYDDNFKKVSSHFDFDEHGPGRSWDAIREVDFQENGEATQTDAEEIPILVAKGEEEWSDEMESVWPEDEIKETDSAGLGAAKVCAEESFESCNSNQSDSSTNSFSFPKLGNEWIGSPVHMPKSEKHKAASLLLHCCRSFCRF